MPRASVPPGLVRGPFTVAEAVAHGLTPEQLRSTPWLRLSRGVYVHRRLAEDPHLLLRAIVAHRVPSCAAFSGKTAAYLDGLDVDWLRSIEVTVPRTEGVSTRAGFAVRRAPLPEHDVRLRKGFRITVMPRTISDLARRLPLTEAVVIADQALNGKRVSLEELQTRAATRAGRYGVKSLRRVLDLAEPKAESPMETRLRLLLIHHGLPRPTAQHEIRTATGLLIARVDLAYPDHHLALEYDGGIHRDRMTADNRRQNLIVDAGWRVLRFTAPDLSATPEATAETVKRALKESTAL